MVQIGAKSGQSPSTPAGTDTQRLETAQHKPIAEKMAYSTRKWLETVREPVESPRLNRLQRVPSPAAEPLEFPPKSMNFSRISLQNSKIHVRKAPYNVVHQHIVYMGS